MSASVSASAPGSTSGHFWFKFCKDTNFLNPVMDLILSQMIDYGLKLDRCIVMLGVSGQFCGFYSISDGKSC